jgi:hypothetical protein
MAQAALVFASAAYTAYAQNKAGKQQRNLADNNAALLERQADDALARGHQDALAVRRHTRQLVGKQQSQAAAQGLDVTTGVPVELASDTLALGAQDEAQVRSNAWREAYGIRGQASNQRLAGRYAASAGRNQALGSMLGGVGESARTYYSYDRPYIAGTGKK